MHVAETQPLLKILTQVYSVFSRTFIRSEAVMVRLKVENSKSMTLITAHVPPLKKFHSMLMKIVSVKFLKELLRMQFQ